MKVAGVELLELHLPLAADFVTAAGTRRLRRVLLVRVLSEEGAVGWGECVAGETPAYSYETTKTARHILADHLLPILPGKEFLDPDSIGTAFGAVRGHPMAKATGEMALWDAQAKELGIPLYEQLGGAGEPLPVGVALGYQPDRKTLLGTVAEHLEHGYARVKLKIGPGHDLDILGSVREHFPDATLTVDAGGSYSERDIPHLLELAEFGLDMIEQPFAPDDLLAHAALQRRTDTPICLDESICSYEDLRVALALEACRVVNVKPGRVGGLFEARRIERACGEVGVPAWVGGMLETGIGRAHNLALATLPSFTLPGDLSESRRYWTRDVVAPEFTLFDGRMPIPSGPGIGVDVDQPAVDEAVVDRWAFGKAIRL